MGLDTTHNCWHGSYGAFSRWRNALAEAAGYMVGTLKETGRATVLIDWGHLREDFELLGMWEQPPADPLLVLIAHSDCEGFIYVRDLEALARRMEELLPLLGDKDVVGHIGLYRDATERFISGLRLASERGEDVQFG